MSEVPRFLMSEVPRYLWPCGEGKGRDGLHVEPLGRLRVQHLPGILKSIDNSRLSRQTDGFRLKLFEAT